LRRGFLGLPTQVMATLWLEQGNNSRTSLHSKHPITFWKVCCMSTLPQGHKIENGSHFTLFPLNVLTWCSSSWPELHHSFRDGVGDHRASTKFIDLPQGGSQSNIRVGHVLRDGISSEITTGRHFLSWQGQFVVCT